MQSDQRVTHWMVCAFRCRSVVHGFHGCPVGVRRRADSSELWNTQPTRASALPAWTVSPPAPSFI